jgi:hypothetical protein
MLLIPWMYLFFCIFTLYSCSSSTAMYLITNECESKVAEHGYEVKLLFDFPGKMRGGSNATLRLFIYVRRNNNTGPQKCTKNQSNVKMPTKESCSSQDTCPSQFTVDNQWLRECKLMLTESYESLVNDVTRQRQRYMYRRAGTEPISESLPDSAPNLRIKNLISSNEYVEKYVSFATHGFLVPSEFASNKSILMKNSMETETHLQGTSLQDRREYGFAVLHKNVVTSTLGDSMFNVVMAKILLNEIADPNYAAGIGFTNLSIWLTEFGKFS